MVDLGLLHEQRRVTCLSGAKPIARGNFCSAIDRWKYRLPSVLYRTAFFLAVFLAGRPARYTSRSCKYFFVLSALRASRFDRRERPALPAPLLILLVYLLRINTLLRGSHSYPLRARPYVTSCMARFCLINGLVTSAFLLKTRLQQASSG